MNQDDELLFSEDSDIDAPPDNDAPRWPVLIVDDEEQIHAVTKLAVGEFTFLGARLDLISAYSAREAEAILRERQDIAVILLDVVMESDQAGLDLVHTIRRQLGNRVIRIILRTGNPGQAPALKVISEYDINDYKEKSELTAEKLIASVYTALSSYRDLTVIERNRRGLETVIEASADIFAERSLERFAQGVLEQLTSLLYMESDAMMLQTSGLAAQPSQEGFTVFAGTGRYAQQSGEIARKQLHPTVAQRLDEALAAKDHVFEDDYFVGYFVTPKGVEQLLYVSGTKPLTLPDRKLIELFTRNVAIAAENLQLNQDLERSQHELVYILSEAIEKRSKETGNHVRRVGECARMLALAYNLPEAEANLLAMAAPLHDAGKIGIPDSILNKSGPHDASEREIMRTHAEMGYEILKNYDRPLLQAAAIVAEQHHEHWDGNGYPHGRAGEDIHIYGRIAAIVDVFDALTSDRCYKNAWDWDQAAAYVRSMAGSQFDPQLVDCFLGKLDQVRAIREQYPD